MCITFWSLRLLISGLLFTWLLTLVTLFIIRCFVCGSHFLTCAFVLHGFMSVQFYDLWKLDYNAACQKLLMTKKFVVRVYSWNFVIWLSRLIYCHYQLAVNADSRWSCNQRQVRLVFRLWVLAKRFDRTTRTNKTQRESKVDVSYFRGIFAAGDIHQCLQTLLIVILSWYWHLMLL